MKVFGSVNFSISRVWFHIGYNLKRFAIGISIDRWGINIDLGPFWFSVEF